MKVCTYRDLVCREVAVYRRRGNTLASLLASFLERPLAGRTAGKIGTPFEVGCLEEKLKTEILLRTFKILSMH